MYPFTKIEKRWQNYWDKKGFYRAKDFDKKPKWYSLIEFPYPSGEGLHVGHIRSNTAMDIISRKRRMEGYNVLYPIGWDAFGLPTENYAIKTGIHPKKVTKRNTDNFRRQLKSLGISFDWSREINTSDPDYYKWTQWLFIKFFEHDLAYKANVPINWCTSCKIGLANEEVIGGKCERCGGDTEKRDREQWMLRITTYADKLLHGLKDVDYREDIKIQQENWIGKSEGTLITFPLVDVPGQEDGKHSIEIFTTRPDTLYGATFMVISPERGKLWLDIGWQADERIKKYIAGALARRSSVKKENTTEKTGIFSGVSAINPANKNKIPVWISDYVLGDVGTGVIMAVPAHDDRDYDFAKKFNLPIKEVIEPVTGPISPNEEFRDKPYTGTGITVNSGKFSGMDSEKAKEAINKFVGGEKAVRYKLRDWVFSRQRYWGEPIPIIKCEKCGYLPVSEKDLPVKLPNVKNYKPGDDGASPLAAIKSWVNTRCPKCKGKAKRETDVMPNWAGSSWYFLRYIDPYNTKKFADLAKLKYFMPVDWYNGGMEHVTLHLLYSRFWNQFLHDLGYVPMPEPYKKRTAHGMILGEGGIKMSKSRGNVINPDNVVKTYGADALRLYEMFMGPFDQATTWDIKGIEGMSRFLSRVWNLATSKTISRKAKNDSIEKAINRTIKKVDKDIEAMAFNTAISALMIFTNECQDNAEIPQSVWKKFLKLLAPFAPFITEELWEKLGHKSSIHKEKWPQHNPKLVRENTFELLIQVNGKLRAKVKASTGLTEKEAVALALKDTGVSRYIGGKKITKIVFVPNRLINLVI